MSVIERPYLYGQIITCCNPQCDRRVISKGCEPEGYTLDVIRLLDKPLLVTEAKRVFACSSECIGPAVVAATRYVGEDEDEGRQD